MILLASALSIAWKARVDPLTYFKEKELKQRKTIIGTTAENNNFTFLGFHRNMNFMDTKLWDTQKEVKKVFITA